jgi:hypothetical protein
MSKETAQARFTLDGKTTWDGPAKSERGPDEKQGDLFQWEADRDNLAKLKGDER